MDDAAAAAARSAILRTFLVFTPLLLLSIAGLVAASVNLALDGSRGLIVTIVLLVIACVLTGYQALSAGLDLRTAPETTAGTVLRKWTRLDMFVIRSYYVHVEENIYKVDPPIYEELLEGEDVTVRHYPHTNTVISVEVHRQ